MAAKDKHCGFPMGMMGFMSNGSEREENGMSDEDFYDAQESLEDSSCSGDEGKNGAAGKSRSSPLRRKPKSPLKSTKESTTKHVDDGTLAQTTELAVSIRPASRTSMHLKLPGNFTRTKEQPAKGLGFKNLHVLQAIRQDTGTVWTMQFSPDGAHLATGGQDGIVRVWAVLIHDDQDESDVSTVSSSENETVISKSPERSLLGHTMPVVDLSWSRSNFLLSASMDKSVRLWHVSKDECLHVFPHPDSVPAVHFHPKEDRFFLSGCFDNRARIWDIPEACVVSYAQAPEMVTAAAFNPSGTHAVVGLLHGQCVFYQMNARHQLNYYTQIECRNSKGPLRKGKKVTGIEFDPEGKHMLVTTNDSRMRLYSTDNYSRICKYKGLVNNHLQIKARFSQDGEYVVCGSESGSICVWRKTLPCPPTKFLRKSKKDRNKAFDQFAVGPPPEGIVTSALFAPASTFAMIKAQLQMEDQDTVDPCTCLLVAATYDGNIQILSQEPRKD